MKSLTAPQLKKRLQSMDRESLEALLMSLYHESVAAKEMLNICLQGEDYALEAAEKYKKKLRRIFSQAT